MTERKIRDDPFVIISGTDIRWHEVGLIARHNTDIYLKRIDPVVSQRVFRSLVTPKVQLTTVNHCHPS